MLPRSQQQPQGRSRSGKSSQTRVAEEPHWVGLIPNEQWEFYQAALAAIRSTETEFLLGGGFALATYTDRWRNTKDIDFYVLPENRQLAIDALTDAGFADYYTQLPYDRGWIYRSTAGGVIVDIIWSMANRRAHVDHQWFERATLVRIKSEDLWVLPIEELLWSKLYVMQHDHCDWPDVLNLLYSQGANVDWDHLLARLESDTLLLKALGTVYDWLCPNRTEAIPKTVRARLGMPTEVLAPHDGFDRIKLLDSRAWFVGVLPQDKQLEI